MLLRMRDKPPLALVFGASGQIGTPLLSGLHAAGWRVLALSRHDHQPFAGLQWMRGDFAQMPALPDAVDAIFSCGPLDLFAHWHAETVIACPRVVAFGSTSATTKHASVDAEERDLARRLQEAEASLFKESIRRGAATTVLRPTLVYGAGRDATLTRIAQLAQRWGRFVLPSGANGLRQPVHVDDLATAVLSACAAEASHGRSYDLPGAETLPYRVMVQRVLGSLEPAPGLLDLPMPLFRAVLFAARMRGIATDLTTEAVRRMREDLVFDLAPAKRDFGYTPRPFQPEARMFVSD